MVPRTFTCDHVFGPETSQEQVFEVVEPLVGDVLSGRNGTVLAYGSTGAGKTHTILGTPQDEGVLQRSMSALFSRISTDASAAYKVYVTYVELYVDKFRDLLASDPAAADNLRLRECKQRGIFVEGSDGVRTPVESWSDARALLERGARNRTTGKTDLNHRSSRSHVILTVEVHKTPHAFTAAVAAGTIGHTPSRTARLAAAHRRGSVVRTPRRGSVAALSAGTRVSKLRVVDLAGAERIAMSGVTGAGLKEANAINTSLTHLSNVLQTLASKGGEAMLPTYRSNKLTWYLRDSLGGRARTLMITHIRPTAPHYQHSLLALDYAQRVRRIRNRVPDPVETAEVDGPAASAAALARIAQLEGEVAVAETRRREAEAKVAHLSAENLSVREASDEAMTMLERAMSGQAAAVRRAEHAEETLRAVSTDLARERRNADPGLYEEVEAMAQRCGELEAEAAAAAERALVAEEAVATTKAEAEAAAARLSAAEARLEAAVEAEASGREALRREMAVVRWESGVAAAEGAACLAREKLRAGAVVWRLARTLKLRELELEAAVAAAEARAEDAEADAGVAAAQRDILWERLTAAVLEGETRAEAAEARVRAAEARAEAAEAAGDERRRTLETDAEAVVATMRARAEAAEAAAEAAAIAREEAEREFGERLSELMDQHAAARRDADRREARAAQRERARADAARATSGATFKELEETKRLLANSEARAEELEAELARKGARVQQLKDAIAKIRAKYVELCSAGAAGRRAKGSTGEGTRKRGKPGKENAVQRTDSATSEEAEAEVEADADAGAEAKRARKRSLQRRVQRVSSGGSPPGGALAAAKEKVGRRLGSATQHCVTDSPSKL